MKIEIHGNPSEDEIAAIVAAIETSWPEPTAAAAPPPSSSTRWRYSGRWWQDGRLPPRW